MIKVVSVLEGGRYHHDILVRTPEDIESARTALSNRWNGVKNYRIQVLTFNANGECMNIEDLN